MNLVAWIFALAFVLYLACGILLERICHGGRTRWSYDTPPVTFIRVSVVIFWPIICFLLWVDYDPD